MLRRLVSNTVLIAVLGALVAPADLLEAQRRVVVKTPRRRVVVRTRPVVHRGFPIRRTLPATVVVRPARTTVVVGAPLVFLPAIVWAAAVVTLPPRERLVWQDSKTIERDED